MTTPSVPTGDDGATAAGAAQTTTSIGLDPKVAGVLAYLGIIGIVVFFIEKDHREVRFHAAQNTLLCIVLFAAYIGLAIVAMIVPLLWLLNIPMWLASFALWIFLVIQGYNLNHVKLPVIGDIAETWAAS